MTYRAEHQFPLLERVRRRGPNRYQYVSPLNGWDDMRPRQAFFRPPIPDYPASMQEAVEYVDSRIDRSRPDLSYMPAPPRVPYGEAAFISEIRLYVRQGMRGEVLSLIEQLNELRDRHDTRNPVLVRSSVVVSDGPIITLTFYAHDAVDYHQMLQDDASILGDEFSELIQQVNGLCRRVESIHYTDRSDLDFYPGN